MSEAPSQGGRDWVDVDRMRATRNSVGIVALLIALAVIVFPDLPPATPLPARP